MKKIHILLFCLFFSGQVFAQHINLTGEIFSAKGPVKHAEVHLLKGNLLVKTDEKGYFSFNLIAPGEYQLMIFAEGFKKSIVKITHLHQDLHRKIVLAPNIEQLDDVVINDTRIEDRIKSESLNIELVNQAFIQRNLGGSLMKTLERIPGIKNIGIGSGQSKPLIRGMGFNRVVVVEKGIKHEGQQWGADHGLEIDQFATGEIELLKGAASFVYGSDAIGGVIDIKPTSIPLQNTFGGAVDLIGKSNNNLYGTSVNLYGRNNKWFFDSRFTYQNYGDYSVPADSVYVYDFGVNLYQSQLRNTAGRENGLHFNTGYIGKTFRSVFYLSNIYSKSGFFANAHGLEPRRVDQVLHDRSDRDILQPYQEVNHFKLINRSSYQWKNHFSELELGFQQNFRQEFSQYVNHGFMPPVYPSTLGIPSDLEREFDKTVYSLNAKDRIAFNRHQLTIGINGELQKNNINGWSFLVPAFEQVNTGIFAYDKYRLNENLILHGALRYDFSRIEMSSYNDWFTSETAANNKEYLQRAANLTRQFNSLVWSAGINYNLEEFSLKANIGKSFRVPIAKELGANGVNYHYFSYEKGNAQLSPEQSYQADISLAWQTEKWSLQLSPFYNYFPNYIYLNPTANHDYSYGAGNQIFEYAQSSVERYGGEFQVKYNWFKNLSSSILGEYVYARQLSGSKKGFTLPFSPPASYLINLTYAPKINRFFSNTYFSIDYRITDSQNNIVPPEKKTGGYQIINLQIGTQLSAYGKPVAVSLQAQNLLNTRYLNHTSFYRLISLPEAGRNLVILVKIPFGGQNKN